MPRISKAETEKAIRELLMSDDDDELDDLPVGLSKKASSPETSNASSVPVSASSTETKQGTPSNEKESEAQIEAKAQRKAKFAQMNLVRDVNDASLLRFHKHKNTYAPCCIRTNHDEAQNLVNITTKNDTLIRYIGFNSPNINQICAVPASRLVPYHNNQGDETRWSADLMNKFKESLGKRTKFQTDTAALLRAEEIVLQRMLEHVFRNQEQHLNRPPPTPLTSEDESSNAAGSHPPSPTASSWHSPNADENPPPAKRPSCTIDYLNPGPKQWLRAGDIIKYFRYGMVASKENVCTATIVKVNPRPSDIALELSNGDLLPRDSHVALLKRRLRNKLEDNQNVRMQCVEDFRLDKSANGKFKIATKAQELQKIYKDARETIVADTEKAVFLQQSNDITQSTDIASDSDGDASMEDSKPAARVSSKKKNSANQVVVSLKNPPQRLSPPRDSHNKRAARASETKQSKAAKSSPSSRKPSPLADLSDNYSTRPATKKRAPNKKVVSNKKRKTSAKPSWQDGLKLKLKKVREERNRSRYDRNSVDTREASLEVAMKVRAKLEELTVKENKPEDELVSDIAEAFDVPDHRLWAYLTGNENNLLTLLKLQELTDKWNEWMSLGTVT